MKRSFDFNSRRHFINPLIVVISVDTHTQYTHSTRTVHTHTQYTHTVLTQYTNTHTQYTHTHSTHT